MKNKVQLFKPIFYILIGTAAAMACLALARDVRLFYASASVLLLGISFALLKMLSINISSTNWGIRSTPSSGIR